MTLYILELFQNPNKEIINSLYVLLLLLTKISEFLIAISKYLSCS